MCHILMSSQPARSCALLKADDEPDRMPVTHPDTTLHDLVSIAAERDSRIAVRNGGGESDWHRG